MGFRETLSDRPKLLIGILSTAVLGLALFATSSLWSSGGSIAPTSFSAFYTTDDGKSWFTADASKLAPFDRNGKQAVRAYLFRCGGGKEFVNHLERFKPDAKAALERLQDSSHTGPPNIQAVQNATRVGREVKRPGDKPWISSGDLRAAGMITLPKCPDGSPDAIAVEP